MKVYVVTDLTEGEIVGVTSSYAAGKDLAYAHAEQGLDYADEISGFVDNEMSIDEFEVDG